MYVCVCACVCVCVCVWAYVCVVKLLGEEEEHQVCVDAGSSRSP